MYRYAVETAGVRNLQDKSEGYSAYCSDDSRCKRRHELDMGAHGERGNLTL